MKRLRRVVGGGGREFYFDEDTMESHWGPDLPPPPPPPVALTCHQTGRRFVFENNQSVWLEEEEAVLATTEVATSSLERFVFDPETIKSPPPLVLCEQVQGDLSSAAQFVYGVLFEWFGADMGTFFPKSIEDIELAFLLPQDRFFTLALLHQGVLLSKDQFTEWMRTWELDQNEWLRALRARLEQCLLVPSLASELGVSCTLESWSSYVSLPASTRVRILVVLARWVEHSKRAGRLHEAVYHGERLVNGNDVYWNFAGVAPNRLYLQLAGKERWKLLTRTKPELVSKIRLLLAAATATGTVFAAILQRWVNVLDPPTCCTGCGKPRSAKEPCTHCIGILLPASPPKHSQDEDDSRLEFVSSAETAALPPQYNDTLSSLDTGEMQLQSSCSPSTTTWLVPTPQKATQESASSPVFPQVSFPCALANPDFQPQTQQDDDEDEDEDLESNSAPQPPATQTPSTVSSV